MYNVYNPDKDISQKINKIESWCMFACLMIISIWVYIRISRKGMSKEVKKLTWRVNGLYLSFYIVI